MKTKQLVQTAILGLILYISQVVFSFIPNVEFVSLLILMYAIALPKLSLSAIFVFILLEGLQWGFGLWWWSYLYVWPILYIMVKFLKKYIKQDDVLSWSIVLGFYGLVFGSLFSIVYIPVSLSYAITYWISGLIFDVIHCISNFILCLLLFKPILNILLRIKETFKIE